VEWLLALVDEQPDMTLDEIVQRAQATNSRTVDTAVGDFSERHNVTVNKSLSARARTGGRGAARRDGLRKARLLDPARWC